MTQFTYATPAGRVNEYKGEILAHAVPMEVLGITGVQKKIPKNSGDNVTYRRYLPYGGATTSATTINQWVVSLSTHATQEGVTPPADTLVPQDISVTLTQYSCLYMYTDKTADMYEDDIPAEMKKQVGERMGLVREMVRWGALKACSNLFYAGGTTRLTVDEPISLNFLRRISRSLLANRSKTITRILAPSANYNTAPVEAAFLVFCHTDVESDIRDIAGFKEVAVYGQRKPVHEMEIGSVDRFRFIVSPELASIPDSGAAQGSTGLYYTTANTAIDVYPVVVVAEDAWGDVALRGMDSFDTTDIKPGQKDKSDPHGQRGYVGAKFYSAAKVLNDGHMAVGEVGVRALT
jgi:N4-gp56 family major capsid protein